MDIKNSQLAVDRWIKEHGVRYFDPLTNMALLTEETGEVARIIAGGTASRARRNPTRQKTWAKNWLMWSSSPCAWPTRRASTCKKPSTANWS